MGLDKNYLVFVILLNICYEPEKVNDQKRALLLKLDEGFCDDLVVVVRLVVVEVVVVVGVVPLEQST